MTRAEFYLQGKDKYLAVCLVGAVPREGDLVNIRKKTYRVQAVTWAVDHSDDPQRSALRANIDLLPAD